MRALLEMALTACETLGKGGRAVSQSVGQAGRPAAPAEEA